MLLGLALACLLLWWRGSAFVPMDLPVGPDWHQYFMAAWKLSLRSAVDYPEFRMPLYPGLIAWLGRSMGYGQASLIMSSVGMVLVVLAAALLTRALTGPWAAGLAALSVPMVATNAEATRWASQYPVFAAITGLALACGAALVRWPRWPLALAAGALAGLAWATDARGDAMALAAGLLVLLAVTSPGRWWQRGLRPLLFALGASLGPLLQLNLQVIPRPISAYLFQFQRQMAIEEIQSQQVAGLHDVCNLAFLKEASLSTAWQHPCGQTLFSHNFAEYAMELPFGLWLSIGAALLVLLPGGRGWRGVLAAGLALAPPLAALALAATLIDVPDRYVVQFAAPLAALVPVAIWRCCRTVLPPSWAWAVSTGVTMGAGLYLLAMGPPSGRSVQPLTVLRPVQQVRAALAGDVQQIVASEDLLLDCTHDLRVEVSLLPHIHHPDPPAFREAPDVGGCRDWAIEPPQGSGRTWLLTDGSGLLQDPPGAGWEEMARRKSAGRIGVLWRWAHSQ